MRTVSRSSSSEPFGRLGPRALARLRLPQLADRASQRHLLDLLAMGDLRGQRPRLSGEGRGGSGSGVPSAATGATETCVCVSQTSDSPPVPGASQNGAIA